MIDVSFISDQGVGGQTRWLRIRRSWPRSNPSPNWAGPRLAGAEWVRNQARTGGRAVEAVRRLRARARAEPGRDRADRIARPEGSLETFCCPARAFEGKAGPGANRRPGKGSSAVAREGLTAAPFSARGVRTVSRPPLPAPHPAARTPAWAGRSRGAPAARRNGWELLASKDAEGSEPSLFIVLAGDGTILHALRSSLDRRFCSSGSTLAGSGLAGVEPDELDRLGLRRRIRDPDLPDWRNGETQIALNDELQPARPRGGGRTWLPDRFGRGGHVRCDGLVARPRPAPTGYNSPNYGPILARGGRLRGELHAPHTLTARAFVVAPGDVLHVRTTAAGTASTLRSTGPGSASSNPRLKSSLHARPRPSGSSCRDRTSTTGSGRSSHPLFVSARSV